MFATEDLRNEHEGIKVALEALRQMALEVQSEWVVSNVDLEQIIDFLKVFVDRCHHGKEEDLLFPALEMVGVAKENGPIGVMLAEHSQGREYIRAMSKALAGVIKGIPADRRAFVAAAQGYVQLLSNHIEKENNVLFVMAERLLSPVTHERLLKGFELIELERIGPGVHERYHLLLDQLRDKYPQTPDAV